MAARGGASFTPPPTAYSMLYNGQTGDTIVHVGLATSSDAGQTWTRYASNPVMSPGASGQWDDEQVHGVSLVWDGSQWVVFYGGYDGTNYRIGRATSADLITWTKYASNPILTLGAGGAFDDAGLIGPAVLYEPAESPAWKMWYTGIKAGVSRMGYADSTDGIAFTKRGQVLGLGSAGQFDDEGVGTGPVVKLGSTYYVFEHGTAGTNDTHTGYATCTDPADSGTYTKQGVLAQFSGNITSLADGLDYRSNGLRSVILRNGVYIGYGTAFQPVDPPTLHEVSFRTTSTDLVSWTTPTGELLPLDEGTFDTVSAENPGVVQA